MLITEWSKKLNPLYKLLKGDAPIDLTAELQESFGSEYRVLKDVFVFGPKAAFSLKATRTHDGRNFLNSLLCSQF